MKTMFAILFSLLAMRSFAEDVAPSLGDELSAMRTRIEKAFRRVLAEESLSCAIIGTVTHVERTFFFLQGNDAALKVFSKGRPQLKVGDRIQVSGKPSIEGGRIVFNAERVEKLGTSSLPGARKAGADDLTFVAFSRDDYARDINWRVVEVKGRAIGLTESGFAMDINDLPVTVVIDKVPSFLSDSAQTHPIVKVKGVAELILDQSSIIDASRWVMGVKVYVAGLEDVVLEPDLIYLANKRDVRLRIAVVGAFVLLGALVLALAFYGIRQARNRLRSQILMGERKRMADDLHDTIEQHIVGAGILLQLGKLKEVADVLLRAKKEMRDIVWGLKNDDMMRLSPAEMIRQYVREENKKGMYRIDCKLSGLPEKLDARLMRDLSLILREAVGNALKHASARKIAIVSEPNGAGGWLLRVSNDGKPYDPSTALGVDQGHFGVEGMKARARRLGAKLSLCHDGHRTVLTLEKQ